MRLAENKYEIELSGFSVIENVYSAEEVKKIILKIETASLSKQSFRKSSEIFAIRRLLKEVTGLADIIFNKQLNSIISGFFGSNYFVVKSIYFDKPQTSNWFVPFHQDLTISVDKKKQIPGFGPWTVKQDQFAVQPPLQFLENIFTIRIHLDKTDKDNGALRVIPGSHKKGVVLRDDIEYSKEVICPVGEGGIMLMKPLLLHSSGRTVNSRKRRVIHIEFSNMQLPDEISWSERLNLIFEKDSVSSAE